MCWSLHFGGSEKRRVQTTMQRHKSKPRGKPREPETSKADRAAIEARIRTRVACDKAAYEMQWELLEPGVSQQKLDDAAHIIQPHHYDDVVTERAIDGLCGYPPCSSAVSKPGSDPKFQISLAEHKVYDVSHICNFCSHQCARSSHQYAASLSTVSLFLREGAAQQSGCTQGPSNRSTHELRSKEVDSPATHQQATRMWLAPPTNHPRPTEPPILKPVAEREASQTTPAFPGANTAGFIEGHQVRSGPISAAQGRPVPTNPLLAARHEVTNPRTFAFNYTASAKGNAGAPC
jgi:hypothetical protein